MPTGGCCLRADLPRLDPRSDPGPPNWPGRVAGPHPGRHFARRRRLSGVERADRRCGPHAAAGSGEEPAAGPARPRRCARGRTQSSLVQANLRRTRHQPSEELAGTVPSPRPTDHLDTMLRAVAELVPSQERAPRCDQPRRPPKLCRPARPGDQPPAQVNDGPRLTMHEVVSGAQLFSVPGAPGRVATAPSYRAARWCRGAAVRGSPRHAGRTGTSVTSTQLAPPKCTVLRHGYGGTGMSNWA